MNAGEGGMTVFHVFYIPAVFFAGVAVGTHLGRRSAYREQAQREREARERDERRMRTA